MPLELVSDNGPGFRSELLDLLCEKLKIKHRYTTPHYPQCNARNEYFNGELTGIIGKIIRIQEKSWNLALPGALWAYRIAEGTQFSPYH